MRIGRTEKPSLQTLHILSRYSSAPPTGKFSAAAQYLLCDHAVVNENGTRMCALFDVSPQALASSGGGFFTTTARLPACARIAESTVALISVRFTTSVGTGSPST